jgi:hypothetical protein
MSAHEPEPVDEFALGGTVEQRGGDSPSDYIPAVLQPGDFIVPRSAVPGCGHLGADCDCGAE